MISEIVFLIILFFIGSSVGSFIEVVRTRTNWSFSIKGRSECNKCKKQLVYYELIPIVSYIVLRGKCGVCNSKIPINHLMSEILMGFMFVIAFIFSSNVYIAGIIIFSSIFLVPILIEDFEKFEIPEQFSISFTVLSFIIAFVWFWQTGSLVSIINGILLALPFFLIWYFSKGKAMGLGDAKLALPLGFLLTSYLDAIFVFFLTFWIGVIGLFIYLIFKKIKERKFSVNGKDAIPLGPSMIVSFYLVILTDRIYCDILPHLCLG